MPASPPSSTQTPPNAAAGSNGSDTVFEPMDAGGHLEVAEAMVETLREGRCAAVATVIGRSGSAPQVIGARLLLHADGTLVGTIGGGAIEAQVLDACRASLADRRPRRIHAHLVRDLGMCCGGSMEVFIEFLQGAPRLFLIGAGKVAAAVIDSARAIGFHVTAVDGRPARLDDTAFARADARVRGAEDFSKLDEALPASGANDYFLIATADHGADERALAQLLRRPHRWIGMLGSRKKVSLALRRLEARENAETLDRSRLRAPVGLALGGRAPGEIAISVLAELIAERRGGDGAPMTVVNAALARITSSSEDG